MSPYFHGLGPKIKMTSAAPIYGQARSLHLDGRVSPETPPKVAPMGGDFLFFFVFFVAAYPLSHAPDCGGYLYTDVIWDSLGSCVHSPQRVCRENAEWEAPFLSAKKDYHSFPGEKS